MGTKTVVPVVLAFLAAAGCRSTTPPPGPDRLVLFAVGDIMERFEGIPKRGCCVLPSPRVRDVEFPSSWGENHGLPGRTVAPEEDLSVRPVAPARSPLFEDPGEALLDHLRSRLDWIPGGAESCRLAMRGGDTIEARGPPAALAVVAGALADLR
jgi:hypothetical protein